jgi:hypothetical protein
MLITNIFYFYKFSVKIQIIYIKKIIIIFSKYYRTKKIFKKINHYLKKLSKII